MVVDLAKRKLAENATIMDVTALLILVVDSRNDILLIHVTVGYFHCKLYVINSCKKVKQKIAEAHWHFVEEKSCC